MLDTILIRAILQPYWRLTRSQTLGVQGIVVRGGTEVLLIRHSYVRGWHLPGGGVERDENLEQSLRRELLEEAGIEIVGRPRLHGVFSNFQRSKGDHIAIFVIHDWQQVEARSAKLEIIEQRYFSLYSLPSGLIDGARRRLQEVFENRPTSAEW
jgi:ADP-ribose pyrophosphatase YjhB (NUDIX family)